MSDAFKLAASPHDTQRVPEGFEPMDRGSAFLEMMGPVYCKKLTDGRIVIGLRVEQKHTNVKGIAHGGMLVTLADSALGIALTIANDEKPLVTVNLSTDFVDAAYPGDWVEAHVDIQRLGGSLAFANCYLHVGTRRILRASGVFAVSRKRS